MAVFLVNSCKFNGCGLTFATLSELIQHIEESHIDSDPQILEQQESRQPPSLALSYVFRLVSLLHLLHVVSPNTLQTANDCVSISQPKSGGEVFTESSQKEKRPRLSSLSPVSSLRSATPTGSEFDDDERCSSDNDSDDSWTTQEEFTSELILSMMASSNKDSSADKPFACPVPGCKKRYKNINGIKYHAKHGHKKEVRVKKAHKCKCGKSYKSSTALQSHALLHHQGSAPTSLLAIKTKVAAKPKKQTSISKNKNNLGLVSRLPVTGLTSQAQTNKSICHTLKSLSSGFPQAVLTASSTGQPATALVTVPVTFSKLSTTNAKDMKVISGFSQQPQQHMLNLIAPSGLVPSGTTITVPIEQITRNLALLQQVKKANKEDSELNNSERNAFTSLLSGHQGSLYKDSVMGTMSTGGSEQNSVELSAPNCILSDDVTSPFTFSEMGYDAGRDEEIGEVETSAERSHNTNASGLGCDSHSVETNKTSFSDLKTSDSPLGLSSTDLETDRKFISGLKSGSGLSTEMEICI